MGITELEDELADLKTEVGNEFRTAFGLKPKMTRSQIKEQQLNRAFQAKINELNQSESNSQEDNSTTIEENNLSYTKDVSFSEQINLLKQLKELLDAGAITQEEFDKKKKEIMQL